MAIENILALIPYYMNQCYYNFKKTSLTSRTPHSKVKGLFILLQQN